MPNDVREISLNFADISSGKASAYPQNSISDKQCFAINNLIIEKKGFTRAPGYAGIKSSAIFADRMRGFATHIAADGTETLITAVGSKIYSVNATTGAETELYDFGSAAETYFTRLNDKLFACNGSGVCKIESATVAYQVGIDAPTGASAAAQAGGSLPTGDYKVAVSYARKVSGLNVLYSYPQLISTVTISGGNLTVRVTCANSSDPQVNNKVIWMTDAGGSVYYYYGESGNNTSTTIDITSNANKSALLNMAVEAVPNQNPPDFVNIYAFDNRLFGWTLNSNVLIYSNKVGTIYDAEKFTNYDQFYGNRIVCPYKIVCLTSVGGSLYINTVGGTFALPSGDISAKLDNVENFLYFKYPKTVQEFGGLAWGVTNDGFRYFNGTSYSIDLSKHIKPDIDTLVRCATADIQPQGLIHRRSGKRTEYHLAFNDTSINSINHCKHLILNIDRIVVVDNDSYAAPWEEWGSVGGFMTIKDGQMFTGQTASSSATVVKEDSFADIYTIDQDGEFVSALTAKSASMTTKLMVPDMAGICKWTTVRVLSRSNFDYTVIVNMPENGGISSSTSTISGQATLPVITESTGPELPIILSGEYAVTQKLKQPRSALGKSVYIVFSQDAVAEENLQLFDISIHGYITRSLQT